MSTSSLVILSALLCFFSSPSWARREPVVGRDAAEAYMGRPPATFDSTGDMRPIDRSPESTDSIDLGRHFLAIHVGAFVDSHAWAWGHNGTCKKIGWGTYGLSYRFGGGPNHGLDWIIRVDYLTYGLPQGQAAQLSFVPMLIFPEAESHFPLYFGAGVGPGVFVQQTPDSSPVALDYQMVGGVRLFNVIGNTGFFVETGIKNHLNLIGAGQFDGFFVSTGALFTF